jgi:hypothetical protein
MYITIAAPLLLLLVVALLAAAASHSLQFCTMLQLQLTKHRRHTPAQ